MQAGLLSCPSCGAAISVDSPQCQYCHALLQTVACPKCMGMMFAGSKFCPHCGAGTVNIAEGAESQHKCPRCKTDLTMISVGKTPMQECEHCGGLWIAASNFDTLCSDAEQQTAALGLQLPPPVEVDEKVFYINCPKCGKLMNRVNFAGRSGVVIQVCKADGVWLDRDEIRRIISFIRAGGLQRARQLEMQQLQYERNSAAAQARVPDFNDAVAYTGSIGHHTNTELAVDLVGGLAAAVFHFMK